MKTWTCNKHDTPLVVTADDIDFAVGLVILQLIRSGVRSPDVTRADLIPLPTHHRHIRALGSDFGDLSDKDPSGKPYHDIIKRRKHIPMEMGKHRAANANTCERIIAQLEAAGMKEEAEWALWMVWWRVFDSVTHEQTLSQYRGKQCQDS